MSAVPSSPLQATWLATLPIWLQHREKVPHYSGLRPSPRTGTLDTPEDRKRLVAFNDLKLGKGFEPGYALGPVGDRVLCGVDLDKCFNADRKFNDEVNLFCTVAREAGAMIEVSRSGNGVHIVWLAMPEHLPATFKRAGVESYTGGRFFAWGQRVLNPGAPTPLDMRPAFAHLPVPAPVERAASDKPRVQGEGRNNYLFEQALRLHRVGFEDDALRETLRVLNDGLEEPLDERELEATIFKRIGKFNAPAIRPASEVFDVVEVIAPPVWTLKPTRARIGKRPEPVRFVLERWMQQGKVGLIASEGGTGKTTLLIHLGVCIITGRPFMGQAVKTQGPFILLSRDDDQDDIDAAVQEVTLAMQLTAAEQALVKRDLYAESLRGDPAFLLIQAQERSYRASAFVPHLEAQIDRIRPACVALDTVRQFTGIESTDEGGQIVFMAVAASLAKRGASVIVAHHVGKQAAREKTVDMYSAIGSSALADNARFMWRLLKVDPSDEDVLLPFEGGVPDGSDLLQLISTRGSLRVKRPEDIWYTRREFALETLAGKVTKLTKAEVTQRRASVRHEGTLEHLVECFSALGVVGRDRARAYFKSRGWTLSNDEFAALKADAEERLMMT